MKIKKIIAGIMAFCVVCGGVPVFQGGLFESAVVANADEIYEDLTYTIKEDGTIEITGCPKDVFYVDIPNEIDGKPVTSIGNKAFEDCKTLVGIKIPDTVSEIGDNAFYCCSNLKTIRIPDGVTYIGRNVFLACSSLESIIIPKSVRQIDGYAFLYCENIKDVYYTGTRAEWNEIKNSSKYYLSGATIHYDYVVKTLEYEEKEDGTIEITGCTKDAVSVDIPNEIDGKPVTSIGKKAFYLCKSLESVTIPESVTSIGKEAFSDCSKLKTIELPEGITIIDERIFSSCSGLESIVIPESVKSIGDAAFVGCSGLESIKIPESVENIGWYAFSACSSLEPIKTPEKVTIINEGTFFECLNFKSVEISENITDIKERAFYGCKNLESIKIPKSVKNIGSEAFVFCKNIKDVYYEGTEEEWNEIKILSGNDALENATIHFADSEDNGTDVLYGDANGDNAINMADATLITQHVGNKDKYKLTEEGAKNADVDGKKGISGTDALEIQRYIAGLIKEFPCEK